MKLSSDSVVTITGGTGSFGTAMAEHLLESSVGEVRIFSRDESKQDLMRHKLDSKDVRFLLGDVRDRDSIHRAVRGATHVFHAAALKQVPSAEFFPLEAMKTNVEGSANVIRSAIENSVGSVVCLSTDKAVYPINAMGITKALMEKTAQAFAREFLESDTTVSITRYGNVLYSRGSVVPHFISQIRQGRPLTVTDASMTRFLMSLAESVELVQYAFETAEPGDIFVKKAPGATIGTLAEALRQIFGADDHPIIEIGSRHGEKLYETLISTEELTRAEDKGSYYRVPLDERDLNYGSFFELGNQVEFGEPYHSHNAERLDLEAVKSLLLGLPEVRKALGVL